MKKLLFTFVLIAAFAVTYAQSPIGRGESQLNAGLGLSSWGLPVYVGLDYGVHEDITVGGELSFRSYNDNIMSTKYRHSIIGISGNGNYHFNRVLNIPTPWDFYAGLNLGFYVWNSPSAYVGNHSSGLGLGGQIGGRYFFSDKFGVNLEFGGGSAFGGGKIGITVKL